MNLHLARPLPDGYGLVSQGFGANSNNYTRFGMIGHNGLDYGVDLGTPILAAHAGVCWVGRDDPGYGNFVYVRYERLYETVYAHMIRAVVVNGQEVQMGEMIGEVGSTGNSTGPHLHLGLRILTGVNPGYRNYVDPYPWRDVAVRAMRGSQVVPDNYG